MLAFFAEFKVPGPKEVIPRKPVRPPEAHLHTAKPISPSPDADPTFRYYPRRSGNLPVIVPCITSSRFKGYEVVAILPSYPTTLITLTTGICRGAPGDKEKKCQKHERY